MIDWRTLFAQGSRPSRFRPTTSPGQVPQLEVAGWDRVEPSGFIGDDAVDTAQIAADAITSTEISDNSISTPKLQANAVTAAKIAANTITAAQIAAGTITATELAADSVTASEIAAGAVTATELAADSVTAEKIDAGAVQTDHLAVTADRQNLLNNGSFERFTGSAASYANPTPLLGWTDTGTDALTTVSTSSATKSGTYVSVVKSASGAVANQGVYQQIPVKAGRTYRLSGWGWKAATGGQSAQVLAHSADKTGAFVTFNVMIAVNQNTSTPTFGEAYYTIPASGVAYLYVYCRMSNSPATSEVFAFEDVMLEELPAGFTNTPAEVVIDDTGVAITNGALTVTNSGSTVIIDGTSNMFKILATGTQTKAFPAAGNVATSSASIASSGSSVLQTLFMTGYDNSSTANLRMGDEVPVRTVTTGAITWAAGSYSDINAGNNRVTLQAISYTLNPGKTAMHRYYVLKEAGI